MKTYTLFLLVLLTLITSCTVGQDTGATDTQWRTGTQGLVMNFVPDNPPSEVLSNQEVNVMVEVTNKGAHDVNSINFYVTGYDSSILPLSQVDSPRLPLLGKSAFNPEGSIVDFVRWSATVNAPPEVDSFEQRIAVTACYNYQTIANPEICIDPQKYSYTATSKCPFDIRNLGGGQGGPIAVSSIRQKTTNNRVFLEIHIANAGSGIPFTGSIGNCHTSLDLSQIDSLNSVSVRTQTQGTYTCRPAQVILHNGKGFIVCDAGVPSGESYFVTPLIITLDYGYRQTASKTMTVVNIG